MNTVTFTFAGTELMALGSGALYWPLHRTLVVSDLHLGKSLRPTRIGGAMLPPYESSETLNRLSRDLEGTGALQVICLGDSFDDLSCLDHLDESTMLQLTSLQAGREWIWIEGNHDPGPITLGGSHLAELERAPLSFRHIATPDASGELSGHYHPKVRLPASGHGRSWPAFLIDDRRIILPAYGTYTGGLRSSDPVLQNLMAPGAIAILTGTKPRKIPLPTGTQRA